MATDIFSKAKCTYCLEEVIGVRIKCAECPDFDLCLQCFSAGAEIGPHKNNHAYQFVDNDSLDIFKSKGGWSAREELALLKGIEVLGFGNWEDISNLINKNKNNGAIRTPSECRDEYMATFVEGSIGRLTWPWALERRGRLTDVTREFPPDSRPPKFTPLDVTFEQALELGYTPKTDHFEKEYENDAETLVSHLNISGTQDDELDVGLKLAQVDMYCQKLRERMRRKRVARDYQLVTKFFNSLLQRPKYHHHDRQPELEENLKFLSQYLTATEFDSLISSYGRQLSLRRRAAELARYRMNGLTRFEEIPHFEQESSSKEKPPNSASDRCWSGVGAAAPPLERQTATPPAPTAPYHPPPQLSPQYHHPQPTRKKERNTGEEYGSIDRSSTSPTELHTSLPPPELQPGLPALYAEQPSHLLSSSETQLCSSLDISPSQYISIKTLLLMKPCFDPCENEAEQSIREHMNYSGWFLPF